MGPAQLCHVKDREVSQAVYSQGQAVCARSLHVFTCPAAHIRNGSLSGRGTNYRKSMSSLNSQHGTYLSLFGYLPAHTQSLSLSPANSVAQHASRPITWRGPNTIKSKWKAFNGNYLYTSTRIVTLHQLPSPLSFAGVYGLILSSHVIEVMLNAPNVKQLHPCTFCSLFTNGRWATASELLTHGSQKAQVLWSGKSSHTILLL